MKKDVLTTIGGLVLVGLVVVATFLYGSQQRQNQARQDQDLKKQQQESNRGGQQNNSPGSQQSAANPPQAGGQNAQSGQPQPAQTPKTGGEVLVLIPAAVMVIMYRAQRRSRQAVRRAALCR